MSGAPAQLRASGVLFDMDGTLVDDQPLIDRVWFAALTPLVDQLRPVGDAPVRAGLEPILAYARGRRTSETLNTILPQWSGSHRERLTRLIETEVALALDVRAPVMPGAAAFIDALGRADVPWAVVTSAPSAVARARLARAGLPTPRHLVGADDIAEGKPSPVPYLAGADALGLPASRCLVFEDAEPGVQSAVAAGCAAVVVGRSPLEGFPETPVVRDFTGVTVDRDPSSVGTVRVTVNVTTTTGS